MKRIFAVITLVAVGAAFDMAAQEPPKGKAMGQQAQQVTVTGCVQREVDYRKAHDKGRAGVAGTGIGADNEFVLINVTGNTTPAPGPGSAYELSGANEGKVAAFIGKRVEITGMLKPAATAGGRATGGDTAGRPPRGVDVLSKDLQLRELEVTAVKASTTGSCP